jgi:hypothetical protein
MIVDNDAANIRVDGDAIHLVELLYAAVAIGHGFSKLIVWGGQAILDRIEDRPWLVKSH